MRLLFIHLSDVHSDSSTNLDNLKLKKLPDTIRQFPNVNGVVLICSGDLANKGEKSEYRNFSIFFDKLKNEIMRETMLDNIYSFIVPGNHDLMFTGNDRGSADILNFSPDTLEDKFADELEMLENFFDFAKTQDCFIESKEYDTKVIKFEDFSLQVNLLNTAPFSTLKNDNKELHYLPDEAIYSLKKHENVNIAITIMHHSPEWFRWDRKNLLNTMINENTDILFDGHDHYLDTMTSTNILDKTTIMLKGGEYSADTSHETTFSISLFDTTTCLFQQKIFKWDKLNLMFVKKDAEVNKLINPKSRNLHINRGFIEELMRDKQDLTNSFADYFVFPSITQKNESTIADKSKIISEDDFLNLIGNIPVISIKGKNNAGKTSIMKYIFNKSHGLGYYPLFMGPDNIKKHNMEKVIKDLFEEQYSEIPIDYEKYNQLKKTEKIMIIDDFDRISQPKHREALIEYLTQIMGTVIISSKEDFNVDLIETVKKVIDNETQIVELQISDFFKIKRIELINKICSTNDKLKAGDSEDIARIIDFHVLRKDELFSLSPEFIIQCVKYFMNTDKRDRKSETIFNVIFETNIKNSIIKNSDRRDVQEFLICLEEIAFYMHFNKTESVTMVHIATLIEDYNKKFTLKINTANFIDAVQKAKILINGHNTPEFQFCSRNHLAYFVASKINKLINKKGHEVDELKYIIDNICFGINDTILLFLSYLRSNTSFPLTLCDVAENLLADFEELDFDKDNIRFIKGLKTSIINLPNRKEKDDINRRAEENEIRNRKHKSIELKYEGLYNYDEKDNEKLEYKLTRAIKYIEIAAKSLNSQFSILEAQEKIRIVDCLYRLPNMILYAILKPAEDTYEELIEKLMEYVNSLELKAKIEEHDIKKIVNDSTIAMCLSVYDNLAFHCANNVTIPVLDNYDLSNSNYSIMNLLIQENGATTDTFIDKAYKMAKESNDEFLHHLIRLAVRKHVITHDELDFRKLDKLSTPILIQGKRKVLFDKKNLLMISGKMTPDGDLM